MSYGRVMLLLSAVKNALAQANLHFNATCIALELELKTRDFDANACTMAFLCDSRLSVLSFVCRVQQLRFSHHGKKSCSDLRYGFVVSILQPNVFLFFCFSWANVLVLA